MIRWNPDKDVQLRRTRGISFTDVLDAIAEDRILADEPHPRQDIYPGQRLLVVAIVSYAYVVPYITEPGGIFLKTVYASRTFTKRFQDRLT